VYQPLHDEDDGDQGGNCRHVIFEGHPENLHWVWDTTALHHVNRNPEALDAELDNARRSGTLSQGNHRGFG
jgi:hypothetical protein